MKKINKSFKTKIEIPMTIRQKVLLSFFVLIFIPLVLLTSITYRVVSKGSEEQIGYAASQAFEQANEFIFYKVNALVQASDIVFFNEDIQEILTRDEATYRGDFIQQNKDMLYLDNFLYSLKSKEDVYRVTLFVPDWVFYSSQEINFRQISTYIESVTYKRHQASKNKVLWLRPSLISKDDNYAEEVSVVSMVRKINNENQIDDHVGFIKIDMLESTVIDIIKKANITSTGVVYIENEYGELIGSSDKERFESLSHYQELKDIKNNKQTDWEVIELGSDEYIYRTSLISGTDWRIVAAIPYDEILAPSNHIRNWMLALLLVIGVIAYLIAFRISRFLTDRITLLSESMIKVQKGELDVYVEAGQTDEIDQLMMSFNYMIDRLKLLVNEQFESGAKIKSAELKALQAQINPHFLYNTLDLINWKALDKGVPEIVDISQALAKFYKLSLNEGKEFVKIRDEVNHVSQYVKIQNMRFKNRITFESNIPSNLMDYPIIKIILQPLVENAILHGILNRPNQKGCITLNGQAVNGQIILTMKDNGVGMDQEQVQNILLTTEINESHGYGVKNIHERLQICYGKENGLRYESQINIGTTVEIRIPIHRNE